MKPDFELNLNSIELSKGEESQGGKLSDKRGPLPLKMKLGVLVILGLFLLISAVSLSSRIKPNSFHHDQHVDEDLGSSLVLDVSLKYGNDEPSFSKGDSVSLMINGKEETKATVNAGSSFHVMLRVKDAVKFDKSQTAKLCYQGNAFKKKQKCPFEKPHCVDFADFDQYKNRLVAGLYLAVDLELKKPVEEPKKKKDKKKKGKEGEKTEERKEGDHKKEEKKTKKGDKGKDGKKGKSAKKKDKVNECKLIADFVFSY